MTKSSEIVDVPVWLIT